MIVALDVDYRSASVVTAAVTFAAWTDAVASREHVVRTAGEAAAYTPGRFFERELPYLRAALAGVPEATLLIVDGFVWLEPDAAGLGAHLHTATGLPVIGVAKTSYKDAPAIEVVRGASAHPLYVTAVGIAAATAASFVTTMHGPYRIPTLLKRADSLARG